MSDDIIPAAWEYTYKSTGRAVLSHQPPDRVDGLEHYTFRPVWLDTALAAARRQALTDAYNACCVLGASAGFDPVCTQQFAAAIRELITKE